MNAQQFQQAQMDDDTDCAMARVVHLVRRTYGNKPLVIELHRPFRAEFTRADSGELLDVKGEVNVTVEQRTRYEMTLDMGDGITGKLSFEWTASQMPNASEIVLKVGQMGWKVTSARNVPVRNGRPRAVKTAKGETRRVEQ